LLDPIKGKTGIRLFTDVTNKSTSGELSLASETMHLGKPEWHLSYEFDFPYGGEAEQELHGNKFSIGSFIEVGGMQNNPDQRPTEINLNLGVRADYLNLGKGVTGGVEVGVQDVGSQNTPIGSIRITKLLGQ